MFYAKTMNGDVNKLTTIKFIAIIAVSTHPERHTEPMNAFLECATCMVRQSIEILNKHLDDENEKDKIMKDVFNLLSQVYITKSNPPVLTSKIHNILKKHLGITDLYQAEKDKDNTEAMALVPYLNGLLDQATDRLYIAAKLAIAGNIIDYGALSTYDINEAIRTVLENHFAADNFEAFRARLSTTQTILYIGDNAGEIVFDQVFIKELLALGHKITFAVKSAPILNDVLMQDAIQTGMDQVVPVIASGSTSAGTYPEEMTPEFQELYRSADIIIAKGQGNFETLYGLCDRAGKYFLLKAKCPYLANHLKLKLRDIVFMEEKLAAI